MRHGATTKRLLGALIVLELGLAGPVGADIRLVDGPQATHTGLFALPGFQTLGLSHQWQSFPYLPWPPSSQPARQVHSASGAGPSSFATTVVAAAGTASLNGHIDWNDYPGSNWLLPVGVQFIQNGVVRRTERVLLDTENNFTITSIDAGTFDLAFSASMCLRKVVPAVVFGGGPVALTVALENGDLSGDNTIGLADLSMLSANYGKSGQ